MIKTGMLPPWDNAGHDVGPSKNEWNWESNGNQGRELLSEHKHNKNNVGDGTDKLSTVHISK